MPALSIFTVFLNYVLALVGLVLFVLAVPLAVLSIKALQIYIRKNS
ncbi:MAG: hypothetical protein HFJ96_05410 [Peptococcaceae bacterium]|jgi:uncharacterized membrane protein|nr:hypothetical protein [Peptococcaceae bacterium]